MTSDPGVTRQDSDYASQIQEALDERSCWIPGSYAAIWPKALNST